MDFDISAIVFVGGPSKIARPIVCPFAIAVGNLIGLAGRLTMKGHRHQSMNKSIPSIQACHNVAGAKRMSGNHITGPKITTSCDTAHAAKRTDLIIRELA